MNFGLSFPVMGKIDVNGKDQHALYTHLKSQAGGMFNSKIKWNFTKFLIDRNGAPYKRFSATVEPEDIKPYINELL